jgi:hypothetical protein
MIDPLSSRPLRRAVVDDHALVLFRIAKVKVADLMKRTAEEKRPDAAFQRPPRRKTRDDLT